MSLPRTFKLTLAYDGAAYDGWQMQTAEKPTIQMAVEAALASVTGGEQIRATGASRTDAGVHALGQVASFQSQTKLSTSTLVRALNAELPRDIVARECVEMPLGFHAIRDSLGKRYRYTVQHGHPRDPLGRAYCWHIAVPLDVPAMRRAAAALVGEHDFTSYENQGSERDSSVRTVYEIGLRERSTNGSAYVDFEIHGNGFLYNMVRNIVGTLVRVGRGKESEAWPGEVLAKRDRTLAGMTAPAQGLYLVEVFYPATIANAEAARNAELGLRNTGER